MEFLKLEAYDKLWRVKIQKGIYESNKSQALMLITDSFELFATITVNFDMVNYNFNEVFLDTNNCPWIIDLFERYNLGKPTGEFMNSGFCTYPQYRLNINEINKYLYEED